MRPVATWLLLAVGFTILGGARPCTAGPRFKPGFGSGLQYGSPIFGGGLEVEVGDHLGVLGGVGVFTAEPTYALGARVYLYGLEHRFRPHGSVFRWREGTGVYLGVDHDLGRRDGFVLTYGVGFGELNLEAPVAITFGVNYRFGATSSTIARRENAR
jgi:hypothetical protein